jgi:hypothetical protein
MKISKIAMGVAALVLASSAFAGGPTVNVTNVGSINNNVSTNANANVGQAGSSYSSAVGVASSVSNGQAAFNNTAPVTGGLGANIDLAGQTATSNSGTAFNISSNGGTGTASTSGSANAGLDVYGTYNNSGNIGNGYGSQQSLTVEGSIGNNGQDGNSTGMQGTSINVMATTNGGGAALATTAGSFTVNGSVGADTTSSDGTTGVNVNGSVSDNKSSVSNVSTTNTLQVTDGNQTITTNGGVSGNASANNSVVVSGSFDDPVSN